MMAMKHRAEGFVLLRRVKKMVKSYQHNKSCKLSPRDEADKETIKYRSLWAHWYVISFSLGGPGFKSGQGTIFQNKNEKRKV